MSDIATAPRISELTGAPISTAKRQTPTLGWQEASFVRNVWRATTEDGTTIAEVMDPEYWAIVSDGVQRGDQIEVMPQDGSWFILLLVRDLGRGWLKVAALIHRDFDSVAVDTSADEATKNYEIKWKGPVRLFAVIRKSDGVIIKDGFREAPQGAVYLAEHIKQMRS